VVKVCQCCGHPTFGMEVLSEVTDMQRRMLEALQAAGRCGLTRDEMVNEVYAFDPDGGPLTARNSLSVQRNKLRTTLRRHALAIVSFGPRHARIRWRLESITEQRITLKSGENNDETRAVNPRSGVAAHLAHARDSGQ